MGGGVKPRRGTSRGMLPDTEPEDPTTFNAIPGE